MSRTWILFTGFDLSCSHGNPCDPDQILSNGAPLDEGPSGVEAADGAGAESACVDRFAGYGASCMTPAQCTFGAEYCALQPGQKMVFCTRTGCKEAPSVCPAEWICTDLKIFYPALPSICSKPMP